MSCRYGRKSTREILSGLWAWCGRIELKRHLTIPLDPYETRNCVSFEGDNDLTHNLKPSIIHESILHPVHSISVSKISRRVAYVQVGITCVRSNFQIPPSPGVSAVPQENSVFVCCRCAFLERSLAFRWVLLPSFCSFSTVILELHPNS